MTVLRPSMKGQNVSSSPMPEYLLPVRKIVGIIFPLISLWNYPAHKNPVQLLSPIQLFVTPWTAAQQSSLSITNSWSLLKIMSMSWFWHHQSVMSSNHLILCCPLLLLPSIFPSIRVFSSESVFPIRWPEYWSFNFNISLSSEYSGLTDLITLQCKSRVFSHTTVQKHQFFSAVKNPPTMWESQETWVWSLGWENPLQKEMATHSTILAWRILWIEESV